MAAINYWGQGVIGKLLKRFKRIERRCSECQEIYVGEEFFGICRSCGYRSKLAYWFRHLTDKDLTLAEVDYNNSLSREIRRLNKGKAKSKHPRFKSKLRESISQTGFRDGMFVAYTKVGKHDVVLTILNPDFFEGAIGPIEGAKFVYALKLAESKKLPIVSVWIKSVGMNMNIDMPALSRMLDSSCERSLLTVPHVSILANEWTYGGTAVSFAQGDIIIADENVRFGFTGKRILLKTTKMRKEELPVNYQTMEEAQRYGKVDLVLPVDKIKDKLLAVLNIIDPNPQNYTECEICRFELPQIEINSKYPVSTYCYELSNPDDPEPFEIVNIAKNYSRPTCVDYLKIFDTFLELKGDRISEDDPTVIGGLARLSGTPLVVIGIERGKPVKQGDKYYPEFQKYYKRGWVNPSGYRKARRLMRLAEICKIPVVIFADTPGANMLPAAEQANMPYELDRIMMEMANLKTWIIAINIGMGGSGGYIALAGFADLIFMLKDAYAATADPSAKSILYDELAEKEGQTAATRAAANYSEITAKDLLRQGYVDEIIKVPRGGAHKNSRKTIRNTKQAIMGGLTRLSSLGDIPNSEQIKKRQARYKMNLPAV